MPKMIFPDLTTKKTSASSLTYSKFCDILGNLPKITRFKIVPSKQMPVNQFAVLEDRPPRLKTEFVVPEYRKWLHSYGLDVPHRQPKERRVWVNDILAAVVIFCHPVDVDRIVKSLDPIRPEIIEMDTQCPT